MTKKQMTEHLDLLIEMMESMVPMDECLMVALGIKQLATQEATSDE